MAKGLGAAEKKLKAFGGAVDSIGKSFLKFGVATTAPLVASGKAFSTYQDAIASLTAAANLSGDQIEEVNAAATELSARTGIGLSKIAHAMIELAKAGVPLEEGFGEVTEAAIKFAKVAEMDVATAAVTLTDAMNVFGVDATMAMDTLSKGADASSISVQQMTESFSQASAVAKSAGLSITETAAAIALLGSNGIKGSDAGTSLKTMLLRLQAPSKEGAEVISELGINIRDASGHLISFRDIIATLQGTVGRLGKEAQDTNLEKLFGQDAIRAANVFLQVGSQGLDEFAGKMEESLPVARKFDLIMSTLSGAGERLMTSLEILGVTIGAHLAPLVLKWANNLNVATAGLQLIINQNHDFIISMAKGLVAITAIGAGLIAASLAAKALGLVLGALGTVLNIASAAVGAYIAVFKALSVAIKLASVATVTFSALSTVLAALASPIGIVTVALVGLGIWVVKTENSIKSLSKAGDWLKSMADTAIQAFKGIMAALESGDTAAAAKVFWAALKVEWIKGTAGLNEVWDDWGIQFKQTFSDASFDIARGMFDFLDSQEIAAINAVAAMRKAWAGFFGFLKESWAGFTDLLKGNIDAMIAAEKKVAAETAAEKARIDAEAAAERKAVAERAVVPHQALLDQQEAANEARRKAAQDRLNRGMAELKAAQDAFDAAMAAAKGKKAEGQPAEGTPSELMKERIDAKLKGLKPEEEEVGGEERLKGNIRDAIEKLIKEQMGEGVEKAKTTVDVAGTFNAAALRGMGVGSSIQEQQLDQQKKSNEKLQHIWEEVRKGRNIIAGP